MPLVLAQNEVTESGHDYGDVLGISYEYPQRYRNLIRTGERFVYYRGRRTRTGPTQPQVYLGTGIIGPISPSRVGGLLTCLIEEYRPFPQPVPFKLGDSYLEAGASTFGRRAGLYFRSGVRWISERDYLAILEQAPDESDDVAAFATGYGDPQRALLIDAVAMEIALEQAVVDFPGAEVTAMPHNNPGFDILASQTGAAKYIGVKGAAGVRPRFFMSEGERRFSEAHGDDYELWVVRAIDTTARTGELIKRAGAVSQMALMLEPVQWRGELI